MAPRIFDDPNHPQYGPVRRLWMILAQLDLLGLAEEEMSVIGPWDKALAERIACGVPEAPAQQSILKYILTRGYRQ
ncbi:MAG TPA: hypothetical protein VK181_09760 [Rhizobium sp.]|nr:hypothetical protein [Rhizobium sp.]